MGGLKLLTKARSAGLAVEAQGDRLVVRGPKRLAAVAGELIENKAAVMAALKVSSLPAPAACSGTGRTPPGLKDGPPTRVHQPPDARPTGSPAARTRRKSAPLRAVTGSASDKPELPTRANPARVSMKGEAYDVAVTSARWFFQRTEHPEAGWTNCSDAFVGRIEKELGLNRTGSE